MVAVPRPATLVHQIADDVGYGAPLDFALEPHEVPQWLIEQAEHDMAGLLSAAVDELDPGPRGKLCELLVELMGDIKADRLIDLRDALRSAMSELATLQCRQAVKRELERRYAAEHTVLPVSRFDETSGQPKWGEL